MLENVKTKVLAGRKYPCKTRELYLSLEEADREILMSLLIDLSVSDHALSIALKEQADIVIADTTIARHRRGLCSCSKI